MYLHRLQRLQLLFRSGKRRTCVGKFQGGKTTPVGFDITEYIRPDENRLIFITDDNLYKLKGDKKELVKDNVSHIWSLNEVKRDEALQNNTLSFRLRGE